MSPSNPTRASNHKLETSVKCTPHCPVGVVIQLRHLLCPCGTHQPAQNQYHPFEKTLTDCKGLSVCSSVLNRLPKTGWMMVTGMIEGEDGRLVNTAIVVDWGALISRYRRAHFFRGETVSKHCREDAQPTNWAESGRLYTRK